eukprot:m.34586 g.34586  ORF g.34586 m.34586 type:complete len:172 (+) comp5158_c0_seq1:76-591(+)
MVSRTPRLHARACTALTIAVVGIAVAVQALESKVASEDTVVVHTGSLRDGVTAPQVDDAPHSGTGGASASEPNDSSDALAAYPKERTEATQIKVYRQSFEEKRSIQIATAESLASKDDYSKQYALAKVSTQNVVGRLGRFRGQKVFVFDPGCRVPSERWLWYNTDGYMNWL